MRKPNSFLAWLVRIVLTIACLATPSLVSGYGTPARTTLPVALICGVLIGGVVLTFPSAFGKQDAFTTAALYTFYTSLFARNILEYFGNPSHAVQNLTLLTISAIYIGITLALVISMYIKLIIRQPFIAPLLFAAPLLGLLLRHIYLLPFAVGIVLGISLGLLLPSEMHPDADEKKQSVVSNSVLALLFLFVAFLYAQMYTDTAWSFASSAFLAMSATALLTRVLVGDKRPQDDDGPAIHEYKLWGK